jgi:hypothetical protein
MCHSGSGIAQGATHTWPSLRTAMESATGVEGAHHEEM